jgi:hypothetical protein
MAVILDCSRESHGEVNRRTSCQRNNDLSIESLNARATEPLIKNRSSTMKRLILALAG